MPRSKTIITAAAAPLALAALATGVLFATTTPSEAKIQCDQGYQRVQGNLLATPYCQDEYLAIVAREYGVKATGQRIRQENGFKREVCRLVGRDIRVSQTCIDSQPNSRRSG